MPVRPPTDDERKALQAARSEMPQATEETSHEGAFVARAAVTDGHVAVTGVVVEAGGKLWDDRGRELAGSVAADGRVTLEEPTERRFYWSGWVKEEGR
jgi:hypothetical protein